MIVDTSALIAILRDEPEAPACARAIENSAVRRVSAANFVEAVVIRAACSARPALAIIRHNRTKKPR